jgi:hypothetical protein
MSNPTKNEIEFELEECQLQLAEIQGQLMELRSMERGTKETIAELERRLEIFEDEESDEE